MPRRPEKPKAYQNAGHWYVRYRFQGERRNHALCNDEGHRVTTARAAAVAVDHMWALIQRGTDPRPEGASVRGLVDSYLASLKNAPRTLEEKAYMLGKFAEWAEGRKISSARDISPKDAAEYLDGLPGGPRWRNLTRTYLATCWKWAKLPNVWQQTEAATIPKRRKPTVSPDTWAKIDAAAYPHHRLMFRFHYATGLRPGEVCDLTWRNVDLSQKLIFVYTRKGEKERAVPLPDELAAELTRLAAWLAVYQAITGRSAFGHVFLNRRGKPFHPIPYYHAMAKTCDRANVPRVNPHKLRHTAITEWLQGGLDLGTARDLAGHHSISVTDIYSHASAELARKVVGKRDRIRDKTRKS